MWVGTDNMVVAAGLVSLSIWRFMCAILQKCANVVTGANLFHSFPVVHIMQLPAHP